MRLRFGLPSIGGVLFNAPGIWTAIKWSLDWKGRYDAGTGVVADLNPYISPWFYPIAVIVGIALIWWDTRRTRKEVTIVITPLALAVAVTVLAVAAWGWYLFDRTLGPVTWTLDEGSPLNWQRTPNGPLWIIGFQIKGKNRWDDSILPSKAIIRSDVNGREVPLGIILGGRQAQISSAAIPGEAEFVLTGNLPPTPPDKPSQIPISHFLPEFSKFTLVFDYQSGEIVRKFSER